MGWGAEHDSWEGESRVHAAMVAAYDAVDPRPAAAAADLAAAFPAADADANAVPSTAGTDATDHRSGCAALLGSSAPRQVVELTLPGADQLSLDGGSRREVHHYQRELEPSERVWGVRRVGGHHDSGARGRTSRVQPFCRPCSPIGVSRSTNLPR